MLTEGQTDRMTDRVKTVYRPPPPPPPPPPHKKKKKKKKKKKNILRGRGYNQVFSKARTMSIRVSKVPLPLEERFVRFSHVALPFCPVKVRYSYGDVL